MIVGIWTQLPVQIYRRPSITYNGLLTDTSDLVA